MARWGARTEVEPCHAAGCARPTYAHDYCQMHYKRLRAGKDPNERPCQAVGEPDGFGAYGLVDETPEGLLCHECGLRIKGLGVHVYQSHGMRAREYKERHGLPYGASLLPLATRELKSKKSRDRIGTREWQKLVAARNPQVARDARSPESFQLRGASGEAHRINASANGRSTRKGLVQACLVCGATWCPLPPAGYKRRTCSDACWRDLLSRRRRARGTAGD